MMIILYVCIAIWLTLVTVDIGIGILRILAGLVLGLFAGVLYLVAGFAEIIASLWRTAFSE
jgi:hypothetical protein